MPASGEHAAADDGPQFARGVHPQRNVNQEHGRGDGGQQSPQNQSSHAHRIPQYRADAAAERAEKDLIVRLGMVDRRGGMCGDGTGPFGELLGGHPVVELLDEQDAVSRFLGGRPQRNREEGLVNSR